MKLVGIVLAFCACISAQTAADPDAEGCKDSKLVSRIKGCKITECRAAEHDQTVLHVKMDAEGDYADKEFEGEFEEVVYVCPGNISPVHVSRNMINAFTVVGYQQVMWDKLTAHNQYLVLRNGPQLVAVEAWLNGDPFYKLTAIREKQVDQQLAATAEAWTTEIENSGRIRVYGINFDTGKATITADSETALNELVKMLKQKSDWSLLIEGHTDNVGDKAANLALSRQRADAVVAWLAAKGIDKARLATAGFGDARPIA